MVCLFEYSQYSRMNKAIAATKRSAQKAPNRVNSQPRTTLAGIEIARPAAETTDSIEARTDEGVLS